MKNGMYVEDYKVVHYRDGQKHRDDGPAVQWQDGSMEWWVNGKKHREDGPAVQWSNGSKEWWVSGKKHR